jgi:hypothetical protein
MHSPAAIPIMVGGFVLYRKERTGDQRLETVNFKFNEWFDKNSELSKYILILSICRNDIYYINRRMLDLGKSEDFQSELFYCFRIGVSHLRELIKFIYSHKDEQHVIQHIETLNSTEQENYHKLVSMGDNFNINATPTLLRSSIMPIRNKTFHYSEFKKNIFEIMEYFGDSETSVLIRKPDSSDLELTYADHFLLIDLFSTDVDGNKFNEILSELLKSLTLAYKVLDPVVLKYLADKMDYDK